MKARVDEDGCCVACGRDVVGCDECRDDARRWAGDGEPLCAKPYGHAGPCSFGDEVAPTREERVEALARALYVHHQANHGPATTFEWAEAFEAEAERRREAAKEKP